MKIHTFIIHYFIQILLTIFHKISQLVLDINTFAIQFHSLMLILQLLINIIIVFFNMMQQLQMLYHQFKFIVMVVLLFKNVLLMKFNYKCSLKQIYHSKGFLNGIQSTLNFNIIVFQVLNIMLITIPLLLLIVLINKEVLQ